MINEQFISKLVVGVFVTLSLAVSIISTYHSFDFFMLSNEYWVSWCLAITFEIGQIASLLAIVGSKKINMKLVWFLMIFLTSAQIMNNVYYSYSHIGDEISTWSDMFGFAEWSLISQKRLVSVISGAFLPLLALGFSKSLVDHIKTSVKPKSIKDTHTNDIIIDTHIDNTTNDDKQPIEISKTPIYKLNEALEEDEDEVINEPKEAKLTLPKVVDKIEKSSIQDSELGKIYPFTFTDKRPSKFKKMLRDKKLYERLKSIE